jgi:hypothetical protein
LTLLTKPQSELKKTIPHGHFHDPAAAERATPTPIILQQGSPRMIGSQRRSRKCF